MTKSEVSAVPSPANAASLASNPSGASFPPIAVIGLSALFPRAASKEQFWANIRNGVDAISEVPSSHWNPDDYFDADPKSPDRTYARRGGFLAPVEFDPLEFGIAPTNVEAIDTSQLLGLVGAKRALQDAGYGSDRQFDRSRVACILGVTGTLEMVIPLGARLGHPRWRKALRDAGVPDDVADDVVTRISESYVPWQENSFPGLLGNVVAGRIANRLDLHGTNCVVDAACASSLSAIHLATLELASGRSDLAVSGGVDTFNDIFMYMCFSKTPALSPTGDARPFSDAADGTALGEGVGMVVLKRLADAQRDGDRVYAVIRGIGTSSDGSGTAVYAPKKEGQIRCLLDAYRTAGVDPSTIELAEAHGTGTKVGDATEIAALVDVYGRSTRPRPWCAVGSIKSQIGHTKAAAGVAGLLKCVLALTHKVLPPTIKVERPPAAMLEPTSPFYVNTSARPWIARSEHPRRAALSAFGFGGSNFHCVLEEAEPVAREVDWDDDVELVTLSANERDALAAALGPWQELATQRAASDSWSDPLWQQCARAAAQSRHSFRAEHAHRLCFAVQRDSTDLPRLISNAAQQLERRAHEGWSTPEGVTYGVGRRRGSLAVLFPGQGAQYPGMLRDLACAFPELQGVLAEADQAYREFAREDSRSDQMVAGTVIERLSDAIYPPPAFSDEARQRGEQVLRATQVAQPAIGAVSLGALAILERFGVTPELVAGHSYGELTALCASQRFEKSALYRLSMLRGRLMAETQDVDGGMLALGAPLSVVEEAIREHAVDLVIANRNAPNQVVLSGRLPEIDRASQLFARKNIRGRKLAVAGAFHSPLFQRAGQRLRQALDEVPFRQSRMPVYANTTAREYPSDASDARDLLAHQVSRPVEFVQEIENLHQAGARLFLEVGPGGVLTGLVSSILAGREFQAVAIDASNGRRRGQHDLALALAQLASFGYAVRTSAWNPATSAVDTQPAKPGARLTIPISGANYVRPRAARPPRAAASVSIHAAANVSINTVDPTSRPAMDMIAPLTDDRPVASVAMTQPQPQTLPESQSRRPPQAVGSAPSSPRAPLNGDHPRGDLPPATAPAPASTAAPAPAPATSGPTAGSSSAVPSDQGGAWQMLSQLAESTARLHEQFLRQQTATLLTIERLLREGVSPASTASVATPTVSAPVAVPPAPAPAVAPAVAEPAASVEPTPVAPAPAPAPVAPVAPAPVAAPAAVVPETPAASLRLSTLLLSVVSQKTGYPVEMLNLSMSLDQDLGIDSIKRVEILSALQEQAPELPAVQPEQLGSIHTLNDIVALLAAFDAPAAPAAPAAAPAPVAAAPVAVSTAPAPAPAAASSRLSTLLLSVVSQKTGYPVEMLNLSMSLDQDLGIDSIKRVEILSALQEQAPELPAVQPEQLGSIHTLNDIVALLAAFDAPAASAAPAPVPAPVAPVAPVAPAPAPAASSRLSTLLLSVVSQKTGYPIEMLNLSMSLDQDLGIDSIKRVEILSALQEQAPELPAVQPEQLGSIHTLNDIVALLAAFAAPAQAPVSPAPVAAAPMPQSTPTSSIGVGSLSIQRLAYRPLGHGTRAALRLPVDAEVWILDDGTDFVCELASALRDRRLTPRIMAPEALHDQPRPERLAGLILTQRANSTTTARELWPAIAALQTAGPALRQTGRADVQAATVAFLAGIVRLDGQFAVGGQSRLAQPEQGALAGLVKTARSEWPDVRCKVLDVATDLPAEALANAVADELLLDGPIEVGLSQRQAGELVLVEQPALVPTATLLSGQLGAQDVVLVTGGARGVTAAASRALARACVSSGRAAPTFVLWGRSAVPSEEPAALRGARTRDEVRQALLSQGGAGQSPRQLEAAVGEVLSAREIRQTLAQLQEAGVRAVYQSVDVTSSTSVTEALAQVSRQFGTVGLLVHGAGVLEDRKIENKTYEQLARVYDTKVLGLKHVLAAIDPARLRGLVLFSSFTGRFGRTGQCDYAMANEALNKLGQDFAARQPQCRVVSFNWGPWAGGMVTPALEQLFAREGVGLIPLAEGAAAVVQELSRPVGSADAAVEVTVLAQAPGTSGHAGTGPTAQAQPVMPEQSSPASSPLSSAALLADGRVSFEVPLSIATVPVLADHVVGGQAVLPLALSIEWLAAAAMHRHPGLELHGVQKLQVRRAVRVGRHETLAVQLVCGKARREGTHFVAPTQLVVQQPQGAQVHLEADVWLGSAPPRLAPDATALPVTDSAVETAAAYGDVLFHGPRLQGLTQIATGADGLTAQTLNEEDPRAWIAQPWRPRWLTVPLAIDGALQALIVWTQQRCGLRSLPMAIARVDVGAMPTGAGSAPLTITGVIRDRQAQRVRADFELRSATGEVVARMIGVEHILDAALAQSFAQRMLNSDT